jgi:glycosyltransferase involved in cell wall biosynthesis
MKLFSFLNRDCEDLLPAWLAHYFRLGVTEFRLIHHGPANDRAWLERFAERYPVKVVDSFDGVFDEDSKCARLSAALGDCRGEWVVAVDSDEFLELPYRSLRRTIKTLELLGAESLYAPMLQRLAVDGSLERVNAETDVEKLFPLGSTHLCERLCPIPVFGQKYPLFFNGASARIRNGFHYPPIGVSTDEHPIRGVTHHFKWRHAMLASMDQRSELLNANAPEIIAYRAWLESNGMKLPLDGAFRYSREKAFELGLLRRPEWRHLRRSVMMKELRNVPGDTSGASSERALHLARQIRARGGHSHAVGDASSVGLPGSPEDLIQTPLRVGIATWELAGMGGCGGIGTSVAALAELLATAGHEVVIFYQPAHWLPLATKELAEIYADCGIKLIQQRLDESKITGSFWSAVSQSCFEWFAGKKFDVIHFPDAFGMGHYTTLAKHQGLDFHDTMICVTLHGPSEWGSELNGQRLEPYDADCGFLERESVRLADMVISPSQVMLDALKGKKFEFPAVAFVHPNVLRPSFRKEAWRGVSKSGFARGLKEAVFIGRLEERKGAVVFCDALDRIVKNGKIPDDFRVTFLGVPRIIRGMAADTYLAQRAVAWDFPIKIESSLSMRRAVDYLAQPGCFGVMPSIKDNYPNTVLECLGASIPFVAFDSGGVPEMVYPDDREKVLVKAGVENLADILQTALADGLPIARAAWDFCEVDLRWLEWHGTLKKSRLPKFAIPPELPALTVCVTSDGTQPEALQQAMEALLKPTRCKLEVILAVGGHPNAEMERALSNIERWIRHWNWQLVRVPGASHALLMQQAATMAETDYLLFLKDFQVPGDAMADTLLRVAVKTDSPVVTCGFSRSGIKSGRKRIFIPAGGDVSIGVIRNCFGSHHFLVRRSSFFELGGMEGYPNLRDNESWHFFLRTLVAGKRIEVIPKVLVHDSVDPIAPNAEVLLEPYLQTIPREGRNLVILVHHALTWLRDYIDFPSADAKPFSLPETHMHSSTVLYNGIAETGIGAEFGSGWHQSEKDGRWTGAGGIGAEIIFSCPESARFVNFSARVVFAKSGDSVSATLNNELVRTELDGDRLKLKALKLETGKNVLVFITRHPPQSSGSGDNRNLGVFFSQIVMEPSNRFGSEPVELSQWFERQTNELPPGADRCVGSATHVKYGFEAWFGEGWHGNELTHRWSGADGRRCTLDIFSPMENARFTFAANLAPLRKKDRLEIFLNGKTIHSLRSAGRISLKNLVLQKGLNVIAMESKLEPVQLSGRDSRFLGWKIQDLEILPDVKNAAEVSRVLPNHSRIDDPLPVKSQTMDGFSDEKPALWHPTDPEGGMWASLLSSAPPIMHTWHSRGFPVGCASALGPLLRNRRAHFLIAPAWSIEPPDNHAYLLERMRSYITDHPLHRLTFLGNTDRETHLMAEAGFDAITVNHNCLLNDAVFRPLPDVSPIYDAVYNAQFLPYKRLELAAETERLALISFYNSFEHTVPQFHAEHARLSSLMPHATFVNRLASHGCDMLTPDGVNAVLAQSRVGLCLSAVEGAMRASIEYLFAGLSVVSTPSFGGRDVYFDDEYCIIADPDPRSIRDAVKALVARAVPRERVRAKTLARVEADRARYIAFVQSLIDEAGGRENFADRFWELTHGHTIMHWCSMREFTQTVMAALPPNRSAQNLLPARIA